MKNDFCYIQDGTINLHTVREGLYLQTLHPGIDHLKVDVTFLALSDQGQIIACSIATDNSGKQVMVIHVTVTFSPPRLVKWIMDIFVWQVRHSLHVFSINGKLLWEDAVSGTITSILTSGRYIIMGNSKGQLSIHDLYE